MKQQLPIYFQKYNEMDKFFKVPLDLFINSEIIQLSCLFCEMHK